ncbi:capsular exopolysaccharide family [Xaviernesmea oryzae]|uniref:non-specific protein-tyrosine kinase n=1 Tax=Xaviernesmea oryzae TaxID=464029 RepID=A0A1X7FIB6_9HYPH|nr:polysaccharide biosynthesis tyrosine autokinase [Xaviernesmea oryzae]SMF52608.1 capsular exopolysaccharide family [Xaviernesmea oryzae]
MIQSSSPPAEQDGIPRLLAIIWERKTVVLLCLLASFAIAAFGYWQSPTRYKSEAILALNVRKLQALPTESVVSPLPQESPVLRTELDIIGSRSMAERVLIDLQKANPPNSQPGKYARLSSDPDAIRKDVEAQKQIDDLLTNVRVMNDGRSYTIYISYYASEPAYAAMVANAFGEAYIDYQIDLQTTATRRVSEWLGERLGSLRTKLEDSEKAAAEFREKSGLIDTGGITLQAQRLSGLNAELTSLQARLAGSKARLATALEVQQSGDSVGLTEVLSSPTIQLLRAEQARVIRAIAEIDESGARMNPQLPQLSSQLASLNKQVGQEISQIIDSLRNEIAINEKQQGEVEARLKDVQRAISATNMAVVQSAQLDREAAANRSIYETYLARYKQTIEQDGIATAEARIISRAMPSRNPTSPDARLWGLAALLLGMSTGLVAALVLNFMDRSIGSVSALQQKTGLAVIGRIPRIPPKEVRNRSGKPGSGTADFDSAVADLKAYIQLSEDRARVIAFTSSADHEGKTFVVANLARSLALSGVKLLVVDANLRDPGLAREFQIQPSPHLARAIAREISFDEVIQRDPASGVDIIAAPADGAPPDFTLGNKGFAALIAEMRQRYEFVLIDAPSASHDLDLLRIASLSDTVTFVVRSGVGDSADIENAVIKLRVAGKHVIGIVLNGVRRQKQRRRSRWRGMFGTKGTSGQKPAFTPRPSIVVSNAR